MAIHAPGGKIKMNEPKKRERMDKTGNEIDS